MQETSVAAPTLGEYIQYDCTHCGAFHSVPRSALPAPDAQRPIALRQCECRWLTPLTREGVRSEAFSLEPDNRFKLKAFLIGLTLGAIPMIVNYLFG